MVPVVELPESKPDRRELVQSTPMEFPLWTRGDDSEDEAVHDEAKRRLDSFRSRTARKRRDAPPAAGSDGGSDGGNDDASSLTQHRAQLAKRSQRQDAAGALVDRSAGAVKRGEARSKDKDSDESGNESGHKKPSFGGRPAPQLEAPKTLTGSPPPGNQSAPSSAPLPQSPLQFELLKVSKEYEAPAATYPSPALATGGERPSPLLPVNRENGPPPLESPSIPYMANPGLMTLDGQGPTPTMVVDISIVTDTTAPPTPAFSAGPRKGVESPPTESAVVTVTKQAPAANATSSSSSKPTETPESDKAEEYHPQPGGDLHIGTEKALVAVGSIGAIIIGFFALWLAWKCVKLRRKRGGQPDWRPKLPASLSLDKAKQLAVGVASRVPFLKHRFAKRSWTDLDKPYDDAFWEKRLPAPDEGPGSAGGIRVHTAFTRSVYGRRDETRGPGQPATSQPPAAARRNVLSMSEMSSLSSGFGDGDIMPPADSKASVTTVMMPAPVAQRSSVSDMSQRRDTMYTEASEDPMPRFRSINSWVQQQSGRVKRAKQRETASDAPPVPSMPPEQDFRLMMPDGEEPQRVETTGHGGYSM